MEKYNYFEQVKEDLKNYIRENYKQVSQDDRDEIYDNAIISDSVTGNASGSYFFSTWKAEEAICHNGDLLAMAADVFGYNDIPRDWLENAETADVCIRCYVIGEVLSEAINELIEERDEQ